MEIILTEGQKKALKFIAEVLGEEETTTIFKEPLAEGFGLSHDELIRVVGVLGLVLHEVDKNFGGRGLPKRDKRRFAAMVINNPPGSAQRREEEEGKFHIPKGHFPTGRNHSGRRKAGR
jgi:hypothetical protein